MQMAENTLNIHDSTKTRCVFISYSWDSDAHKNWVLQLATSLQQHGVKTLVDQWDVTPGMNLQQYMEYSVRTSDFVLLVCTPNYADKANRGDGGVGYEKSIITGEIFHATGVDTKFIPLLSEGRPTSSIPSFLASRVFIDFRKKDHFEDSLEELLRHIFDAPRNRRPPLGPPPAFASSSVDASVIPASSWENKPGSITIAIGRREYRVDLPIWWDSVKTSLPESINTEDKVRDFTRHHFGTDEGTPETWKSAWKAWLQHYDRSGGIPVYLAHCLHAGGDLLGAARLFAELYEFHADTEMSEWYETYLAYSAGTAYRDLGQSGLADIWFTKAAQHAASKSNAVSYYAQSAQKYIKQNKIESP